MQTHFQNRPVRNRVVMAVFAALMGASSLAMAQDINDVVRLIRAGQLAEANTRVDQLLAAKPNDAQTRFVKGVVLTEQGKNNEAIAVFTKLTTDFPDRPEPYNNLAVLYTAQNQLDKARAALESAIRTNPSYATAHENLGDVYAKQANQAYTRALQLDASNTTVPPKLALIRELFTPGSRPPAPAVAAAKPAPAATPAASVVAAAPAKPAIVAAPTAPTKPAVVNEDKEQVEKAVHAWARAWAAKDMGAYLASYGRDFTPAGGASRADWESDRRARITGKNSIKVQLSNMRVSFKGDDKATVHFRQDYQGDALKVSSNKALAMAKSGNRWVIVKELAGG